jgi:hypothetical protein
MLQRKQSLFLLLAALLAAATWLFPIATYERGAEVFELRTTGLYAADGTEDVGSTVKVPFSILHSVLAATLLVTIFLYRNRPRQRRVVRGTYMLALALIAFQFITDNSTRAYLGQEGRVEGSYGLAFFLPLVVLVLMILADRGIKADEDLVRSMDRLR